MKVTGIGLTTSKDETDESESELEIQFAKIGNHYLNTCHIERFLVIDDDISAAMSFGADYVFTSTLGGDDDFKMTKAARKINESVHDIIYIESSGAAGEDPFEEDQASNLLYRKWLENSRKDIKRESEPLLKKLLKRR